MMPIIFLMIKKTEILFDLSMLSLPEENMNIPADDKLQEEENENKGDESVQSVQDCSSQYCNNILNNKCLI